MTKRVISCALLCYSPRRIRKFHVDRPKRLLYLALFRKPRGQKAFLKRNEHRLMTRAPRCHQLPGAKRPIPPKITPVIRVRQAHLTPIGVFVEPIWTQLTPVTLIQVLKDERGWQKTKTADNNPNPCSGTSTTAHALKFGWIIIKGAKWCFSIIVSESSRGFAIVPSASSWSLKRSLLEHLLPGFQSNPNFG